jgi:AraC-like DNA-binding protein
MIFEGKNKEYLLLEKIEAHNTSILQHYIESSLSLLWITSNGTIITIDGVDYHFSKNQIVCLTEFNTLEVQSISSVSLVKFNRSFYCILHKDSEVGCKGLLFFGASRLPLFTIPEIELEKFELLWKMFRLEMESQDELQIEMLQMMLKRLLILSTRIHKEQNEIINFEKGSLDLIREFNYLVEIHFRAKHFVAQYAEMLNKSPKTLSNLFSKAYNKSPLQFIQDRILLESTRLLLYTDKPIKEIAFELGFEDIQSFSRFFKTKEGISPTHFKINSTSGRIDNLSGKRV